VSVPVNTYRLALAVGDIVRVTSSPWFQVTLSANVRVRTAPVPAIVMSLDSTLVPSMKTSKCIGFRVKAVMLLLNVTVMPSESATFAVPPNWSISNVTLCLRSLNIAYRVWVLK